MRWLTGLLFALLSQFAYAGNQIYEPLSASVQAALHAAISDQATPFLAFDTVEEARAWLDAMSNKLERRMPGKRAREEFLVTVHYEAKRACRRAMPTTGSRPWVTIFRCASPTACKCRSNSCSASRSETAMPASHRRASRQCEKFVVVFSRVRRRAARCWQRAPDISSC